MRNQGGYRRGLGVDPVHGDQDYSDAQATMAGVEERDRHGPVVGFAPGVELPEPDLEREIERLAICRDIRRLEGVIYILARYEESSGDKLPHATAVKEFANGELLKAKKELEAFGKCAQ